MARYLWRVILAMAGVLLLDAMPGLSEPSMSGLIGPGDDPGPAVFQVEIVVHEETRYTGTGYGTGFFIAGDGTALTASHVIYRAHEDPVNTQLLAIVDKEFYSAEIVCASKLSHDPARPTPAGGVPLERDVAQIKIVPSTFPFATWGMTFKTGEQMTIATAHRGAVPEFPYLKIGGHPGIGDKIRVVGYGHISPIARKWMAAGQISEKLRALDGTEIFSAEYTSRPQPGNSGSPVLNNTNQVVGLFPWASLIQSNLAHSISNSALEKPCP